MKRVLPYLLITLAFGILLLFKHPQIFSYKFNQNLVHDYLRSQDIFDPKGLIHDRIFLSDSEIYMATGYMYATGTNPATLNIHPPLVKYIFGFSTVLTGNPLWVQIGFGLILLWLTYFLGTKLLKNQLVGYLGVLGLLIDPVFGGMMNEALLDLGQAVFALGYVILMLFFPESFIFQGIALGLFAASKFWSTAIIFVILVWGFRVFIKKGKINWKKVFLSFVIAVVVFSLTYIKSFIDARGLFNIFAYQAMVLKFMLTHNSAVQIGGPIILFVTSYFAPWWQGGVTRAIDWSILWPAGLIVGVITLLRRWLRKGERDVSVIRDQKIFIYLLPFTFLLLSSTQVPFTRYFIIILPFVYLGLADGIFWVFRQTIVHFFARTK